MRFLLLICLVFGQPVDREKSSSRIIEIPLNDQHEVSVAQVVSRLAEAGGIQVGPLSANLLLPTDGVSRALTRRLLSDCLGPDFAVTVRSRGIVLTFAEYLATPEGHPELKRRLKMLAARAEKAAHSRQSYSMHAMRSYRPNDPTRPTVCLVHGLNSSSEGFKYLIRPLEEAGYGVVVFDYPFNRSIDESSDRFRRQWVEFRHEQGERRPWAILAHSMGCLVARSLVEEGHAEAVGPDEVSSLILIAPVNHGAHVARLQEVLQLISNLRAINNDEKTRAFSVLSDGIGKAAEDLLPGSHFLQNLNRHERCKGIPYHILAGDSGVVTHEGRQKIEARIDEARRLSGILGGLARIATRDLPSVLDELSDGTGDGCVSVQSTRLDGVDDHVTIHANHAELIRAPILFSDAGPVACMPFVLRWLRNDLPIAKSPSGH
jgi:pimeloyl-ACP methyl ester carboxylesterase